MKNILALNNGTNTMESSNFHSTIGEASNLSLEEINEINNNVLYLKIASIFLITGITLLFGFIPFMCQKYKVGVKILGLANAFSGGLFMGIGLFHLLPESGEAFEHYFSQNNKDSNWKNLPCSFFVSFLSYALILFIEKVAFDSHSLTAHNHSKNDEHDMTFVYDAKLKELDQNILTEALNPKETQEEHLREKSYKDDTKRKIQISFGNLANKVNNEKKYDQLKDLKQTIHDHYEEDNKMKEDNNGFVTNENEEIDQIGANIDENKQTTRPRTNTYAHSNMQVNQMRKKLHVDLSHDHIIEKKKKRKKLTLDGNCEHDHSHEQESDPDLEEATLKNVVSSKGKFMSLLQARNMLESTSPINKPDVAMFKASQIINRTIVRKCNSMDEDCITNMVYPCQEELKEEDKAKRKSSHHSENHSEAHQFKPKSKLAPYILLIALSIHGLFEGIALGIQRIVNNTLFLLVAVLAHKWAEAFSLGISFYKNNTSKDTVLRMMILFSMFTPVGIFLGMILLEAAPIIEGIFLGISAGTFIYISASEVIVEEFAITKYRYEKFLIFISGGIFAGLLLYLEEK